MIIVIEIYFIFIRMVGSLNRCNKYYEYYTKVLQKLLVLVLKTMNGITRTGIFL